MISVKVNLAALQGAFLQDLRGRTATKRCLIIPVDEAHLFVGQKGVYLNLTGIELQNNQFGDTHFIKQNFDREVYEAMTPETRKALPIIGSIRPVNNRQSETIPANLAPAPENAISQGSDDLPF